MKDCECCKRYERLKEDFAKRVERLKDKVEYLQKDYANLDICDKEEVIKLINEIFGDLK